VPPPYPIAQFLPIMDEIAGLFIRHNFGTFIFQDLNNAQLCTAIVLAFVLPEGSTLRG